MSFPNFYAVVWGNPPDLSTREVFSFPSRPTRDDFVLAGPPGGPGWRLEISGRAARSMLARAARQLRGATAAQPSQPSEPPPARP